jgi:hypothetical protein
MKKVWAPCCPKKIVLMLMLMLMPGERLLAYYARVARQY